MDQSKKGIHVLDPHAGQFEYLGRWVDKKTFRTFVYDKDDMQKLANSYDEYQSLLASGLWFAVKPSEQKEAREIQEDIMPPLKIRKQKHGTSVSTS